MKSIKIISKTKKGSEALHQHYKESNGVVHKLKLKTVGLRQVLLKRDPFTLKIEIINEKLQNLLTKDTFLLQIEEALEKNGATRQDYDFEVEE